MKTVEQLAREAGWTSYDPLDERHQRFHDLAIAQYREGLLAGVGEPATVTVLRSIPYYTADQLAAAVLRERERCAKLCISTEDPEDEYEALRTHLAKAIRG